MRKAPNNAKQAFHIPPNDMKKFMRDFRAEMNAGLKGKKGSLKMLPTYAKRPTGRETGEFLALDLGGTNFRVASLLLKGNRKTTLPQIKQFVLGDRHIKSTGKALFDFISRAVLKFMAEHRMDLKGKRDLGFTFSFPMRKKGIDEGVLIAWTKGFSAKGVEGKGIVGLMNESLKRSGLSNTRINAVINDTVSTLVAGSYEDARCDVGVILGTGTNACYYEKAANISKLKMSRGSGEMIVNIEWGNFNKIRPTRYDRLLDRESRNPGKQLLEKMISGMYLGKLAGLVLKSLGYHLKPEDLKSEYLSEIEADRSKGLFRVNKILKKLGIPRSTGDAKSLTKSVCSLVSARAARLAALAMASVVTKLDPRLSGRHTIAIDGSLYEKHPGFAKGVRATFKEIFGKKAVNITLIATKDASVKGAAIIAATK